MSKQSSRDVSIKRSSSAKIWKHTTGKKSKASFQGLFLDKFTTQFQQNCNEQECFIVPQVSQITGRKQGVSTNIGVGYDLLGQNPVIVICRHLELQEPLMKALRDTIGQFNSITTLKLEFCGLEYEKIFLLCSILMDNVTITELSVSGNTKISDCCDMLFQDNQLTSLSMKFCNIGILAMVRIVNEMANESCGILHLNLASNFLFDECIPYVAQILRINRKLISLNLADNKITDVGCNELFMCFQKFPLDHSEIKERRYRKFQYYIRRMSLLKKYGLVKLAKKHVALKCVVKEDIFMKTSKQAVKDGESTSSREPIVKKSRSGGIKKPKSTDSIDLQSQRSSQITRMIDDDLGMDRHPFVIDSWEEDKQIYCRGNFTLLHLNVSYNKVTNDGLDIISQALKYQAEYDTETNRTGLLKLVLEGNNLDFDSTKYKEIEKLLSRRFSGSNNSQSSSIKSSGSFNRRRLSSRRSLP